MSRHQNLIVTVIMVIIVTRKTIVFWWKIVPKIHAKEPEKCFFLAMLALTLVMEGTAPDALIQTTLDIAVAPRLK